MKFVGTFTNIRVKYKPASHPNDDWVHCSYGVRMHFEVDDESIIWLRFETDTFGSDCYKARLDENTSAPIVKGERDDTVAFRYSHLYHEVQFHCSVAAILFNDLMERFILQKKRSPLPAEYESSSDYEDKSDSDSSNSNFITSGTSCETFGAIDSNSRSCSIDDIELPPAMCSECGGIGPKGMICSRCEDNCLMFDVEMNREE